MSKSNNSNSLNALQLQLEEALQMLRLVAAGKRTSIEVREWLESNHSSYINENETIENFLQVSNRELR